MHRRILFYLFVGITSCQEDVFAAFKNDVEAEAIEDPNISSENTATENASGQEASVIENVEELQNTTSLPNTVPTNSYHKPRKNVLIVGEYRGGANFVSEFFNRNTKASYIFEILYLTRKMNPSRAEEQKEKNMEILTNYFQSCQYPLTSKYLKLADPLVNADDFMVQKDEDWNRCNMFGADLCFPGKSRLIYEEILGADPFMTDLENRAMIEKNLAKEEDEPINIPEEFTRRCLRNSVTAAKAIRADFPEIKKLDEMVDNLSIIYVFRDPRAMLRSQIKSASTWIPKSEMETYIKEAEDTVCDSMKKRLEYLTSEEDPEVIEWVKWQNGKMLFLRYEDLAIYPKIFIAQMYFSIKDREDLFDLTQALSALADVPINKTKTAQQQKINGIDWHELWHGGKPAFDWIENTPFDVVQRVQNSCGKDLFLDLGYKYYENEEEYEKMKSEYLISEDTKQLISDHWKFGTVNPNFMEQKKENANKRKTRVRNALKNRIASAGGGTGTNLNRMPAAQPGSVGGFDSSGGFRSVLHSAGEDFSSQFLNDLQNVNRTSVIILDDDSNSSFSEMFNQNLNSTFIAEPLYLTRRYNPTDPKRRQAMFKIISEYLNSCELPTVDKYLLETDHYLSQNLEDFSQDEDFENCKLHGNGNGLCFGDQSRLFMESNQESSNFKENCQSRPITSLKLSQIRYLKHLQFLRDWPKLKIIYLIRDPRMIVWNKIKSIVESGRDFDDIPEDEQEKLLEKIGLIGGIVCDKIEKNLEYLNSDIKSVNWMTDKLMVLRYEDVILSPNEWANEVFNFLQTEESEEHDHESFLQTLENDNVLANMTSWKEKLHFKMVQKIQEECGSDLFDMMGYTRFDDEEVYAGNEISTIRDEWLVSENKGVYVF